jgi:hypothetical protein
VLTDAQDAQRVRNATTRPMRKSEHEQIHVVLLVLLTLATVGSAVWQRLCMEHGIDKDGILEDLSADGSDRKSAFFYQADDEHIIFQELFSWI